MDLRASCEKISANVSPPPYRDVTVGNLLTLLAGALPDAEALVYAGGPRYTFAALEREAREIARGLIAIGVEPGDRVAVWATNVPQWIVLEFALAKIGAILVTVNTSLRAPEVEYLLRQSDTSTLVTIRGFRGVDYIATLDEIGATRGALPALRRIVFVGDRVPAGLMAYEDVRAAACRVANTSSAF